MTAYGLTSTLTLLAATPLAGTALVNATPIMLTWTVPNDGQLHRFLVFASMVVSVNETGGAINVNYKTPDGTSATHTLYNGGLTAGEPLATNPALLKVVQPGTTVTIGQSSALTGGAAILWAEIWGR